LKNAESNAEAKDLEKDELTIKNIVVQQAPVSRNTPTLATNVWDDDR